MSLTLKGEVQNFVKSLESQTDKDRSALIDVQPHVYFIDPKFLKKELDVAGRSIGTKHITEAIKSVQYHGKSWKEQGIGGVHTLPSGIVLAYLYSKKQHNKAFKSNFVKLNRLHREVVDTLSIGNKDINTGNMQRGHFFSSVAAESRGIRIGQSKSGLSLQSRAHALTSFNIAKGLFYNNIRRGIRQKLGKLHFNLDFDFIKTYRGKNNEISGDYSVIFVTPQTKELNEGVLSKIEASFHKTFQGVVNKRLHLLTEVTSSFSIMQLISKTLDLKFLLNKVKTFASKSGILKRFAPKFKIEVRDSGVVRTPILADIDLPTQAPINLIAILNARLHDAIEGNMGEGTAHDSLNYRTGRFAKSAIVTALIRPRENHVIAFYTYMKYPYATFDPPDGIQYKRERAGPQIIIDNSIREIAAQVLHNRFLVTPRVE